MIDLKVQFANYLLVVNEEIPSYNIPTLQRSCNLLDEIEAEFEKAYHFNIFEIHDDVYSHIQKIKKCLRRKQSTSFGGYNGRKGSGIPSAILNKHFENFLLNAADIEIKDKEQFLPKIDLNMEKEIMKEVTILEQKKQIVLQGAPGTGKTYKTAEIAVAICDGIGSVINHKQKVGRERIMERYKELKEEGRICFTTFHQSMDYEEFIEGIKPIRDEDDNVSYCVKDGIFKSICRSADCIQTEDNGKIKRTYPTIWKVSLQGTGNNPTRTDCMNNNRIRIGWDEYGPTIDDTTNFSMYGGKSVLDAFINKMQVGDYVLSCYSARTIDAIGIVTGDYEWLDSETQYRRSRSVEWIIKDINEDIYELNNNTVMTLSSVYKLNNITYDNLEAIVKKYNKSIFYTIEDSAPYVLIIDEINRGNISKIFGELITLLEADKRIGEENEVTVTLPYSQETFGVPSNLYIIGTMNTADRSVGYIDYAVRRRFAFITLNADRKVIEDYYQNVALRQKALGYFDKVDELMKVSSDYDKEDLMIGHSYFLAKDEEELKNKMCYEVRPLLMEYFNDGLFTFKKGSEEYLEIKRFGEE